MNEVPIQQYVDKLVDTVTSQMGELRAELGAARAEVGELKVLLAKVPDEDELRRMARVEAQKVVKEQSVASRSAVALVAAVAGAASGVVGTLLALMAALPIR